MTREQIYKKIAEAYYCEPELRTEEQTDKASHGICYAIRYAYNFAIISDKMLQNSKRAHFLTPRFRYDTSVSQEHDFKREYDLIRADFCTLMSILTDKEYEEISK